MSSYHQGEELGQEFRASRVEMNTSWRTLCSNIPLPGILEHLRSCSSTGISVRAPHPFSGWKHRALEAGRMEVQGRGRIGGTPTLSFACPPSPAHLPTGWSGQNDEAPFPTSVGGSLFSPAPDPSGRHCIHIPSTATASPPSLPSLCRSLGPGLSFAPLSLPMTLPLDFQAGPSTEL